MEPNELNDIVNTLADRLGVAAEKLVPIAETLVREVEMRNWAGVILGGIAALAGWILLGFCVRCAIRCTKAGSDVVDAMLVKTVASGIVGFFLTVFGTSDGGMALLRALSPTYTLLKSLM